MNIKCCPKCKRPLNANDFLGNVWMVGVMHSIPTTISCTCGYRGFPIELSKEDYEKWIKEKPEENE